MRKEEVLFLLREHREQLAPFKIKTLAIFGSVARDEADPDSDIDILVEFNAPVGLFEFVRLQRQLEEMLHRRIDLATPDALREPMKEQILREAIYAN